MENEVDIRQMQMPTIEQLQAELKYEKHKKKYKKGFMTALYSIIVVVAISVLIATMVMPVMEISGKSMEPTLKDKEVVVLLKTKRYKNGDLICFSYQNKLLIKRVIGLSGDVINIDKSGNVFVNGTLLNEPYIINKAMGECDIEFPYQVPENHYFVMGDERTDSIDSRSTVIGPVSMEQSIGKIFMRISPFNAFGFIK